MAIEYLVGNTPLVELCNFKEARGFRANLFAKLEMLNPAGSVKDRVALAMLQDAKKQGALQSGATIIEPTSGNTGIALAMIAAAWGHPMVVVMPESMSPERRRLIGAYGAKVILTEGAQGMYGAIARARQLHEEIHGSFLPVQFSNPANPMCHYQTTGPEIYRDRNGEVDIFVAGVGTGGTITGVGRYLKQQDPKIQIVAVEPAASAVLSGDPPGQHGIQGIGAGFVPETLDLSILDTVISVTEHMAVEQARLLAKQEGILTGISGGAALYAATLLAHREENAGKNIVVLLPDGGERYLFTDLF